MGQANSRKQQNHILALLEGVYQVLQVVCNTPVLSHLISPIPSHANAIYFRRIPLNCTVADIIFP